MSSPIRDCGESWRSLGEYLNDFLYVDGKPNLKGGIDGTLVEHTKEELIDLLVSVNRGAWGNYEDIANELEWK